MAYVHADGLGHYARMLAAVYGGGMRPSFSSIHADGLMGLAIAEMLADCPMPRVLP